MSRTLISQYRQIIWQSTDNTQISPGVVQPSDFESNTPLGRDQMPRCCDRVKRSFPAVAARGIATQS